jgi:hypothetical protein
MKKLIIAILILISLAGCFPFHSWDFVKHQEVKDHG